MKKLLRKLFEWRDSIECENLRAQRDTCRRIICEFVVEDDLLRAEIRSLMALVAETDAENHRLATASNRLMASNFELASRIRVNTTFPITCESKKR